jgi:hypothetical protein
VINAVATERRRDGQASLRSRWGVRARRRWHGVSWCGRPASGQSPAPAPLRPSYCRWLAHRRDRRAPALQTSDARSRASSSRESDCRLSSTARRRPGKRSNALILNKQGELFPSPIRYDQMRPMSAVLHAKYSYTYVLALALAIFEVSNDQNTRSRVARHSIAKYVPKLRYGYSVITSSVRATADGERFLGGLFHWTERLFEKSVRALSDTEIPERPFAHPLVRTS